ncbi:MAG: MoxR-like ATPase [Chlamydiales bacterium]|jgi:MoxR-like ATPase
MSDLDTLQTELDDLGASLKELRTTLGEHFLGQEETTELLLLCMLARGHALLEGAPGLGKTTLVRTLSALLELSFARIQFTPDLMPADILGTRVLHFDAGSERKFTFEPGPIFTQVLLADEINRATPRAQSAMLEAMQEHQVTLFGETRHLDEPFMVIATQNPIEMEGTYPLPEAQLDRFLFKIELSMPDQKTLERVLTMTTAGQAGELKPVLNRKNVLRLQALLREVPASSDIVTLVSRLILATHPSNETAPDRIRSLVRHGASPRGGQALLLASKARALLRGRLHVTTDDVRALAAPTLRHRLVLSYEGEASGVHADELVDDALSAVGL